mgnify:CR=1 FL=1
MQIIEKIVERLEEYKIEQQKDVPERVFASFIAHAITGVIDKTIEIVKKVAEEENDGWIPCEVKMPTEKEEVCYVIDHSRMISENVEVTVLNADTNERFVTIDFTINGKWVDFEQCVDGYKVLAWRPLPKPYQPKEEKEQP